MTIKLVPTCGCGGERLKTAACKGRQSQDIRATGLSTKTKQYTYSMHNQTLKQRPSKATRRAPEGAPVACATGPLGASTVHRTPLVPGSMGTTSLSFLGFASDHPSPLGVADGGRAGPGEFTFHSHRVEQNHSPKWLIFMGPRDPKTKVQRTQ
jgi:hypothetical protein